MIKVDLHLHSSSSDGLLPAGEVVSLAVEEGLSVMAITDHDTVSGVGDAVASGSEYPSLKVIPGIEFSVAYVSGDLHLVGLFIDHENTDLLKKVSELTGARADRGLRMVEDLRSKGINITYDEVIQEAEGGTIGKPHIARILIKHGYASDFQDVFSKYLEDGRPGFAPKKKAALEEALSLVKSSGGIPVLAHPASLNFENFNTCREEIRRLYGMGVEGIEVYAAMHSESDVALFGFIAEEMGLMISGGSDFHGEKNERLGYYGDGRPIPSEKLSSRLLGRGAKP